MASLDLWLIGSPNLTLDRTLFSHLPAESQRRAVRGKTAGAYDNHFSFQWSPAVQALTILLLRVAASRGEHSESRIEGGRGSPAASLDYSLGKLPLWLLDMFGVDAKGSAVARRLFKRSNPEQRRDGPVAVSVNQNLLRSSDIRIFVNGNMTADRNLLGEFSRDIEMLFSKRRLPVCSSIQPERQNIDFVPHKPTSSYARQALFCPCCGFTFEVSGPVAPEIHNGSLPD